MGRRGARRTARRTSRRVNRRQDAMSGGYDEGPPPADEAPPAQAAAPADSGDMAAEIEKLADLHAKGILTDEEFAAGKAKLLG